MYKKLFNKSALASLALLSSGAVMAQGADTVICNDCNAGKIDQLISQQADTQVYVVDFVNATAKKFEDGKSVKLSVSELNSLNHKFDYRKTTLRAVN